MAERGAASCRGLTRRYGSAVAVDRLDLDVRAGEFLSLLGPSGCGKSTTLRLLAGLEQPDAGDVAISGEVVTRLPAYRRDVNTVFQDYALFPHMTVGENVAYGLRRKKVARDELRKRTSDALVMVQMREYAERRPDQLSGGQRQRVALARALVNRPAVLLLDEPLSALDRRLRQDMQIELKLIQAEVGITFVYVTHDQEEAMSLSDRIAVMRAGRIEQLDTPDAVYDTPATAFVAGFVGQQNFFAGTLATGGAVALADGTTVPVGRVAGAVVGDAALAAVRPEHVRVTREAGGGLRGTLVGTARLGELVQQIVRLPSGQEVVARAPRAAVGAVQTGDEVWCAWRTEHAQAFAADGAATRREDSDVAA